MSATELLEIAGYGAAGLAAGTLYFLLLHRSVGLFVRQGMALQAVPYFLARAAAALAVFWFAAQAGAWPLLAAAAGFVAARTAVFRLVGRRQ